MIPLDHLIRHSLAPEAVRALADILAERRAQDAKWSVQNHEPIAWLAILAEEVGEVAKEVLGTVFPIAEAARAKAVEDYRAEVVQVAAVALSMLECLDRNTATNRDRVHQL